MHTDSNYWTTRRVSRRAWLRGASIGVAGLAGAALVGCGGGSSSTPTATAGASGTPTGTTMATGTATQAPMAKTGGTLQVANGLDPSSLDPQTGVSGGDHYYWYTMFDQLVYHDVESKPVADRSLATSWEIPDNTTITFHLRDGVKFHDGSAFDAETVKWNIERVQDPTVGSTARASFLPISSIDTPDASTVTFKFTDPDAAIMWNLGDRGGAMVSRQAVEQYGKEFSSHPVGTGPFIFEEWVSGSHVSVKKNPDYWRKDASGQALPYLDGINMRVIPDATAALAALTSGEVDLSGVQAKDVKQVQGDSSLQLTQRQGSGLASLFTFNQSLTPLASNADFRRAVCYAVDPAAVNQAVFFGLLTVAKGGCWPVGTWVYQDVPDRPTYDPQKAKDFLQKANVGDNPTIEAVTYGQTHQQEAELYQQQLKQVGINLKITVQDVGQATNAFFKNNQFPMYVTAWSLYPEPDYMSTLIFSKDGAYNPAKESTPQLEDLIKQGRQEFDQEKRKAIYQQISESILTDALYVPLLYGVSFEGAAQKVQGVEAMWTGEAKLRYDELWFA